MLVLTWNLFHGRAQPELPRSLLREFGALIARWDWDVALLQEVPPWWPPELARSAGASARWVRTSRNVGLAVRRAVADRRPDLIKSNGGGANVILVRGTPPLDHRSRRLRWWPERRWVHAVRLERGVWVANVHAQAHPPERARADLRVAGAVVRGWAGDDGPVVLGGDCNVPDPHVDGFVDAGGHRIDRILVRGGLAPVGEAEILPRDGLSDHAPVRVHLRAS
jgi:endonuclease/exonuclease/phosphatase family metal-dependent hydrolase